MAGDWRKIERGLFESPDGQWRIAHPWKLTTELRHRWLVAERRSSDSGWNTCTTATTRPRTTPAPTSKASPALQGGSMSIERLERQGDVVWRVGRREGGHNRAKVLGRKRDAEAFDADIRRRKRAGELVESASAQMTLSELAHEWLHVYGAPNLARSTLESYAITWDRQVLPHIGGLRLRELTPQVLERYRSELAADGVGLPTQRRVLVIVQGILQRAVEWGYIPNNPAKVVRKPAGRRPPRGAADGARRRRAGTGPFAGPW